MAGLVKGKFSFCILPAGTRLQTYFSFVVDLFVAVVGVTSARSAIFTLLLTKRIFAFAFCPYTSKVTQQMGKSYRPNCVETFC